ncbi:MAG TPA: bacteriohemerythrin [Candidatus Paceibacterota bacterium]
MSFIDWDESFSVGIQLIDKQHQKLFALINAFHDGEGNIEQTLLDLLSYIDFHFKTEEKYFEEFGYENTKAHEEQHKFYEQRINELCHQCLVEKQCDEKVSDETQEFVRDWIMNHIKIADKQYIECFHSHGLR